MEVLRMNYYFTGLIILALTMLALFVEPAYPRNEYLNEYGVRCGEFETRIEAEDRNGKYNHYFYLLSLLWFQNPHILHHTH